jgi:hypothetical protein
MELIKQDYEYMNCIKLAQDRTQWRAVVNMVANLCVPINGGEFLDRILKWNSVP